MKTIWRLLEPGKDTYQEGDEVWDRAKDAWCTTQVRGWSVEDFPAVIVRRREVIPDAETPSADSLTKRERFAMAAMQGMMTTIDNSKPFSMQGAALVAIGMADALIAALNTKEGA
jgi:hypothetical protein